MASNSEDLAPLIEEDEVDDSSVSSGEDFDQTGGLTPIAESEEDAKSPQGYFHAFGVKDLNANLVGNRAKEDSPFEKDVVPDEVIGLSQSRDEAADAGVGVGVNGVGTKSKATPDSGPSVRSLDSGYSKITDDRLAERDSKETEYTGRTTVHFAVKDAGNRNSVNEPTGIPAADRTDSILSAETSRETTSVHLDVRTPDDSTRKGTPDSFRSFSRTSEEMDRVRTPLIVANIGVMNLDEDVEVNLSNTLTLPGMKQGPHFMVGTLPAAETKRKDDVRLPRLKKQRFTAFDGRDGRPGYESPLKNRSMEPMARFRRAARLVQLILTAITSTRRENQRREAKLMSFYQLQDEIGTTKGRYGDGLDFDPTYFRACRQIQISDLAKHILMMDPKDRTDEQRHVALVSLTQAVDAFGEFPIKMQKSLVKRGWYEHFEAKRVIIRQGHAAENFYFILSGTAVVTILSTNKKTGESVNNTVAFLKKGNSFGELALMYGGTRNATVTCKDNVELLAVARDDFVDIFMHVDKDVEPDHIQFLRLIEFFDGWPIERLPYADPKTCLFTYFRRGVIMCRDSISSEWIYVVKTGSCRVLKALQPVKADMQTIPSDLRGSTNSLQGTPNSPRRAPPLSNRNESNKSSSNQRYLPPLKGINHDAAKESRIQHKANIDKIYEDRHQSTQKRVQFEKAKAKPVPNAKVYVEIQKLGPKETFGFVSVAFQLMEEPLSLILVSDGAECVLINKRFFLQHLSESHHKYLRKSIQPFPTEEHLQQKLQDQVNWDAYKAVTFHKEVIHNKKLHDTLLL